MNLPAVEFSLDEDLRKQESSEENDWEQALTVSNQNLKQFPIEAFAETNKKKLNILVASKNEITDIPCEISLCFALKRLDLSKNQIDRLPIELFTLPNLNYVDLGSNLLSESCLDFSESSEVIVAASRITHLVLSNNKFAVAPWWIPLMIKLSYLHMGANSLKCLPSAIEKLTSLQDLYLGGNKLLEIPESIGSMLQLSKLIVNDNHLVSIPDALANLRNLKSLMLHGNRLKVLPQSLIKLQNLEELSLRGNPLVDRFVRSVHMYNVPSLKELASRFVVKNGLNIQLGEIPETLMNFLKSSQQCINPACGGVYFTSCVEHVKFVDFCGRYRVPFLIYLCSPNCEYPETDSSSSSDAESLLGVSPMHMRRVLLG